MNQWAALNGYGFSQGANVGGYYQINGTDSDVVDALASGYGESGYGELGYYDISPGMGAVPQGMQPRYAPRPNPAQYPRTPPPMSGLRVRESEPKHGRVLWLGFKTTSAVAAAAAGTAQSSPQDPFAARKVIVPATVAPNFEIADIKVGAISQLTSSDAIPGEAFIPDSVNADVRFDTAQISQQITFAVNNISAAAAVFRAALNGFVARQ